MMHAKEWWDRRPSLAAMDEWYTGYAITIPALAGSWLTFLYFGAGIWAVLNALVRRYPMEIPRRALPFVLACLAFPAVMAISGILQDERTGLSGELLALAAFPVVPLLIGRYRASDPRASLEALIAYAPLGAAGGLAAALLQIARGSAAASGGAGNSAVFGTVMALLGAISLAGALLPARRGRAIGIAGFAMGMVGVLLSDTRTLFPMLALLPIILVAVSPTRKLVTLTIAATLAVLVIAAFNGDKIISGFGRAAEDIEQMSQSDVVATSVGMRLALWEASVDAIADSPILGFGPQNKMDAVMARIDPRISYLRFGHVHNGLLDATVAAGVFGMAAFLALLAAPLAMVFGSGGDDRIRRFVVLSVICIFGLANATSAPFRHDLLIVAYLLPLIVVAASDPVSRAAVWWNARPGSPWRRHAMAN